MQPASTGTNLKDPAKRPARYGPVMTNDSDHIDAERTSGVGPRPGPGRRPGPSKRPCTKGLEHDRQRAQYPRGQPAPRLATAKLMPGPALHSHSRGAKTPPAAPTSYSGRGPGLRPKPKTGPKAVPDSFHRKGNSADPPPVTTRILRGGPRCTAFPRGPTTRTRRSSVIRRRAARLVMARDATQLSTRTRHTSCTGPNDVSGDSDTLPRPTAQPGATHAPGNQATGPHD
jgi:hypothetical protein